MLKTLASEAGYLEEVTGTSIYFAHPYRIEIDTFKNERTKVFYCNPMASY